MIAPAFVTLPVTGNVWLKVCDLTDPVTEPCEVMTTVNVPVSTPEYEPSYVPAKLAVVIAGEVAGSSDPPQAINPREVKHASNAILICIKLIVFIMSIVKKIRLYSSHGRNAKSVVSRTKYLVVFDPLMLRNRSRRIAIHPWYIRVQFHPEFKSTPWDGHPLFNAYIKAALDHQDSGKALKPVSSNLLNSRCW